MHFAVDFGSVCLGSARSAAIFVDQVDNDLLGGSDLRVQLCRGNLRAFVHQALVTLFLDFFRNRIGQRIGLRALNRLKAECAHPVELRLIEPFEQIFEILISFARKARDEGRSNCKFRTNVAPCGDTFQHLGFVRGAAHGL